ncbi:MAG: hypothetical protein J6O49_18895 [Bacteroidaceae bacterium]|nr:hypothetical protein [Bacteroidaceae bacterium]
MAIGAYGTTIPINIDNSDIPSMVDISYCYHDKRSFDSLSNAKFTKLNSAILTQARRNNSGEDFDEIVEGMYNLQLPLSEFNKKGFYTVYIKPKEVEAVIADVGALTAFPNVRGLVIDSSGIDGSIREKALSNNGLVGYRIIYISDSGARQDYYRIITSNNRCEPVVQAPNSSSDKSYTYRYDDASPLIFVTVSPSSAPTFKENATPFIGKPTQKILLVNTYFEPIMLDIEMTAHDADTISYMLESSQLRDLDNGLVTTYNDKNEIYNQSEHFTLKDQYTGKPVFEVKQNKNNNVDFSQTIDDKIS